MAAKTFADVWRLVQLHASTAPASLVQSWTQSAYDKLIGQRHWAWTRRESLISTLAARTLEITFTSGSTAITSAAGFVATDAGRQVRVGTGTPIYTIATFTDASNAVLAEAYGESSGAADATISSIYLPMPADFRSIYDVTDLALQRPVAWWIGQDRLDLYDPSRISSDTRFRVLAAKQLSQVTSLLGRVLYEAWPHPTAAGNYRLQYFVRTDTLTDDTEFQGVLATYTEALLMGALARAAKWPGTATAKNPYFNLALARELQADFETECLALNVMDDDQYLMDLQQIDLARFGLAAVSADPSLLRMTDASANDTFGGL